MLPEITTVVQIGGAWVGLSLVGALGSTMADKVGSILIQRWEKNIEAEARKMPPIVITQPTAPHVLDLNSPCPSE